MARLEVQAESVEEEPTVVLGGVPVLVAVVDPQGAADVQAALAVVAAPGDMWERLAGTGRLVGGRRARLGGQGGATGDEQTEGDQVSVHAMPCKVEAVFAGSSGPSPP